MVRLAVPVNLPAPPEPLRTLSRQFNAVNSGVTGVNVVCSICRTRGRVNSMLLGKGKKKAPFVCGSCHIAEMGEPVVGGTDPTNGTS